MTLCTLFIVIVLDRQTHGDIFSYRFDSEATCLDEVLAPDDLRNACVFFKAIRLVLVPQSQDVSELVENMAAALGLAPQAEPAELHGGRWRRNSRDLFVEAQCPLPDD